MIKEKILFVTAFPPNNKTAGQSFTYSLIKHLEIDYVVNVIYFGYRDHTSSLETLGKVENYHLIKLLRSILIPFIHPFFSCRFSFTTLVKLYFTSKKYDYLYFDYSQVFLYSLFIPGNKILMIHDVITQKYSRNRLNLLNHINFFWIQICEFFILHNSKSKFLVFSDKDKILLTKHFNVHSIKVDFYLNKNITLLNNNKLGNYFCFYGAWTRSENLDGLVWFIDKVIPHLNNQFKFVIIGGGINTNVRDEYKKNGLEILGFVEDPYPVIAGAKALIAPLFSGAGVKVKVLESLACGTPVIGTNIAFEGIDICKNHQYLARDEHDFVNQICSLKNIDIKTKNLIKNEFRDTYPKNIPHKIIKEIFT